LALPRNPHSLLPLIFPLIFANPLFCCGNPVQKAASLSELRVLLDSKPVEGIPLETFRCYQHVDGAATVAKEILADNGRSSSWSNAVFALGAIGGAEAYEALENFLRRPTDPLTGSRKLSPLTFDVKVDTLFGFGYMVLHSPDVSRRAQQFLDLASSPRSQVWRGMEWESPYHVDLSARNDYLASKVRLINRTIRDQSSVRADGATAGVQSAAAALKPHSPSNSSAPPKR
jgi:hypothetical protein